METRWDGWALPRRILLVAALLSIALLVPAGAAFLLAGPSAGLGIQVALMTPGVVLLGSSGSPELIATQRALMTVTVAGAALAVALGLGLRQWDERRTAGQPQEVG